jgi:predicted metalloprotease with PDZ domain
MMNNGMGGLEHTNSMAVFTNRLNSESGRVGNGWLSFIAHEFFHLYNVKTIRPIDLGPFDYDRENYTTMLWFSEGVTSYYENLILNRAGFFTRDDVLRNVLICRSIRKYSGPAFSISFLNRASIPGCFS